MGVVFLEHMGGRQPVNCSTCGANLSDESELINEKFIGDAGPLRAFYKAVNVTMSEPIEREMFSGKQIFRLVYCKKCETKLGWICDYVMDLAQEDKVGKFFFEKARITGGELLLL